MSRGRQVEWPTVAVAVAVYAGWLAVTLAAPRLPWFVTVGLLAVIVAWHGSLQHETIHGHPFRRRRWNDALGTPPLSLWIPYAVYRESHLRHHRDRSLTDPVDDPESSYVTAERWAALPSPARAVLVANRTLLGHLVLGPFLTIGTFWWRLLHAAWHDRPGVRRLLLTHAVPVAAVLVWVLGVCGMPLWEYLLGAVLLARSLASVRSFAEHRWVPGDTSRTAVVRAGVFFSLLYLHNNLHHAHHARPSVPWYELPALAERVGSDVAAAAGAGWYRGYRDVARRHLLHPVAPAVHPAGAAAVTRS